MDWSDFEARFAHNGGNETDDATSRSFPTMFAMRILCTEVEAFLRGENQFYVQTDVHKKRLFVPTRKDAKVLEDDCVKFATAYRYDQFSRSFSACIMTTPLPAHTICIVHKHVNYMVLVHIMLWLINILLSFVPFNTPCVDQAECSFECRA